MILEIFSTVLVQSMNNMVVLIFKTFGRILKYLIKVLNLKTVVFS